MKKNKLFLALLPFLLVLPSCNSKGQDEPQEENLYTGKVVINEFENYDDMYRVKQLLQQISYGCDIKLDIDKEVYKNGQGSLSVLYNNSTYGQVYQRIELSKIKDCPVNDIAAVSIWVYNDNDYTAKFDLNIVGKETQILSTYTEEVEPRVWTEVTYEINKVSMDAIYEDVRGFSFFLEKNVQDIYPTKIYVDDMSVTFGAKQSEDDEHYLEIVNQIVEAIKTLPESIAVNDEDAIRKCKDISKAYSELPVAYRPAVTNYDLFQVIMQTYIDAVAEAQALDSDVTAFHFDTCFGLAQTGFTYTQTQFGVSYSDEVHYQDEEGSLHLEFSSEKDWLSMQGTSSINMQNYEYIEFSVLNNTVCDLGFCLTWDTLHIVKTGEWQTFIISTNYAEFAPTFLIEFEFTNVDESYFGDSAAHAPKGDVYLSSFKLHRKSASSFLEMLEDIPDVVTADDEELINNIRYFYESLHKDEKAKITKAQLAILEAAEKALLISKYENLSSMIDALPAIGDLDACHGYFVLEAYKIMASMTDVEKTHYLYDGQEAKLNSLYSTYTSKYEYVLNSKELEGDNLGSAWDIRVNSKQIIDSNYGDIAKMDISNVAGANTGALEVSFKQTDASSYKEVVFYVKAPHDDTFYLSRSGWRGGDNNMGYVLEKHVAANTWTRITMDASLFSEACYFEFYFGATASLGETYYLSSFYGVLN